MPIMMTTPPDVIRSQIERATVVAREVIVRRLAYIGEMCLNKARSLPNPPQSIFWDSEAGQPLGSIPRHTPHYIDWTGNLRSSIGYIITVNGEVVQRAGFEQTAATATDGPKEGKELADELAMQYPRDIALIFVAGMNYAAYVKQRGYDVTDSAQLLAEKLVATAMKA